VRPGPAIDIRKQIGFKPDGVILLLPDIRVAHPGGNVPVTM
jgi:hypothetical protein